ncbi:MAG: 2-heptaprenyl-1,4-naphthoquinone methyltransferase [Anaerolineales bacterium]|nr:MAG: 2-heptaprenyl-1,4-naphthoquinone methyltransferase [Anaerolineales bacterium]
MNPRDQTRQNYNRLAKWYDLFAGSEKRFTDIGIQMLDVQPDERVLEIGCGTGHALNKFAKTGGKVVAIDLSEKMLKAARGKIQGRKVSLCQADGLRLPFASHEFTKIFISFTLELFETPEIPQMLSEIHRMLEGNGKLGVVSLARQERLAVHIYEWFHRQMPTLVDCHPIYLQPVLKEAGFQVQKSTIKTMWGLPVEIVVARK